FDAPHDLHHHVDALIRDEVHHLGGDDLGWQAPVTGGVADHDTPRLEIQPGLLPDGLPVVDQTPGECATDIPGPGDADPNGLHHGMVGPEDGPRLNVTFPDLGSRPTSPETGGVGSDSVSK